jgi:hypothetical protein
VDSGTPHTVETAWAMLGLIYGGQVCSRVPSNALLKLFSITAKILLEQFHYLRK